MGEGGGREGGGDLDSIVCCTLGNVSGIMFPVPLDRHKLCKLSILNLCNMLLCLSVLI